MLVYSLLQVLCLRPMRLLVFSIRHRHAPIAVREALCITEPDRTEALRSITQQEGVFGASILSTCNRTEIYLVSQSVLHAKQSLQNYFSSIKHIDIHQFQAVTSWLMDDDAVLHAFHVASGLDSLIIGEGQILNQVKESFQLTKTQGTSHPWLDRLAQHAVTTGKRVRTETGIARKDASVSKAAYDRIKSLDPDFLSKRIALIGGGKMATLVMNSLDKALPKDNRRHISILNRSETRLNELTQRFGFQGYTWNDIEHVIKHSDILFVATGAPHILLRAEHFSKTTHPQLIMDVSVPRNVCDSVGHLPHVQLFNTDDLKQDPSLNTEEYDTLMAQVKTIIHDEFRLFHEWFSTLPAIPIISTLRQKVEQLRQQQIITASHGSEHEETALHAVSKKLVNKILHDPLVKLRQEHDPELLHTKINLLKELFDLSDDAIQSATSSAVG